MLKINSFVKHFIVPVPPELRERFDDHQLQNTVFRLKALMAIGLFSKLIEFFTAFNFADDYLFYSGTAGLSEYSPLKAFFTVRNSAELVLIAFFFLFILPASKKISKKILWTLFSVSVASSFALYAYDLYVIPSSRYISSSVTIIVFLFTMLPDFKPKVFIVLTLCYALAVVSILLHKNTLNDGYFESTFDVTQIVSNCVFFIIIILITKILLYNSKVKNYILNNDLQHYNHNLKEIVDKKTATIEELKNAIMETIADIVEHRDATTGDHISRTSASLKILIEVMLEQGLYREQTQLWNIEQLILSAQLHDVGKIMIDDNILRKPAKLTDYEFDKMKMHTLFGGGIIKEMQEKTSESEFLDYAYIFAMYHHEKWDGSGYPYGIVGENIPLPARLMAIIDVYDALISERPYKQAFTHEESVNIIQNGKGTHFDPVLAELFMSASERFADNKIAR
jgi:response regulator RpfG family c-di-GMP phosphodiesterase